MLRQSAVFSAPGKIILFGEHSVVYGKRALASSISLRSQLTISIATDVVELHLPEIKLERSWSFSSLVRLWEELQSENLIHENPGPLLPEKEAVLRTFIGGACEDEERSQLGVIAFLHLFTSIFSSPIAFSIHVKSDMPIGAGLGSSAAYSVCLAGALLWSAGKLHGGTNSNIPDSCLKIVSQWAYYCDQVIHGKCSGVDNTICSFGGCVNFKANEIKRFDPPSLRVLLVNTNISRNTKALVEGVKEKYDRIPSIMDPLFTSFDKLVELAVETLNEMKDTDDLGKISDKYIVLNELIDLNHCLLSAIGVSHSALDTLVNIAKNHNLHAKLTGAGGGGFGFILIPLNAQDKYVEACRRELDAKGFFTVSTKLGGSGLSYKII